MKFLPPLENFFLIIRNGQTQIVSETTKTQVQKFVNSQEVPSTPIGIRPANLNQKEHFTYLCHPEMKPQLVYFAGNALRTIFATNPIK